MKKIKGMTFAPFAKRGELEGNEVQKSLQTIIQNTGSNTVILAPAGIQKTSHSTEINWNSELTASDEELVALINYAHSLGVQVFLKPTANTANGEWRAFISFLKTMFPANPNGVTGSVLIQPFSSIMPESQKKPDAKCLSLAVKWS